MFTILRKRMHNQLFALSVPESLPALISAENRCGLTVPINLTFLSDVPTLAASESNTSSCIKGVDDLGPVFHYPSDGIRLSKKAYCVMQPQVEHV